MKTKDVVKAIIQALHREGNTEDTVREMLFTIYTGTSKQVYGGVEEMLSEEYTNNCTSCSRDWCDGCPHKDTPGGLDPDNQCHNEGTH